MQLAELAWACDKYGHDTNLDASYETLLAETGGAPDLTLDAHRLALLRWLSEWGSHQFRPLQYSLASAELAAWWESCMPLLPGRDRLLQEMSAMEIAVFGAAYGWLQEREASTRTNHSARYAVSVGPTGASRILFALRPDAVLPWDGPLRASKHYDGGFISYTTYLTDMQNLLLDLAPQCAALGFALADLPARIGLPSASLPRMVDAYHWVTLTRGETPTGEALAAWEARLAEGAG